MRKLIEVFLLGACLIMLAESTVNLTNYAHEEARSDALDEELNALHVVTDYSKEPAETAVPDATEKPVQTPVESVVESAGNAVEDNLICENIQVGVQDNVQDNTQETVTDNTRKPAATESHVSSLDSLHAVNSDCVAWITISDTSIDYPVMHKPDSKDYYLHHDFYGNESKRGTLYLSEICNIDSSDNLIIYGHNMSSGTMFAHLTRYKDKSYGTSHRYIVLETLSGVRKYELICALAMSADDDSDFRFYDFSHANSAYEYDSYLTQCLNRACYSTGVTAQYGDQLLTLVTCEYSHENGRMLVVAKRIS